MPRGRVRIGGRGSGMYPAFEIAGMRDGGREAVATLFPIACPRTETGYGTWPAPYPVFRCCATPCGRYIRDGVALP